jgi:NAD-dependent dihydropyrimidine dehydrogenase PreA subunit
MAIIDFSHHQAANNCSKRFYPAVLAGRHALHLFLMAFALMIYIAGSGICAESNPALPDIRGKMTLNEVSRDFDVPSAYLIEHLKLPPDTSLNEPLKNLKDRHGFEIDAVRNLVGEYRTNKSAVATKGAPAEMEQKGQHADEHQAYFPVALIISLYGIFCIVMLWLLWKNKVNQKIRLAVLACAVLIFGVLFRSQTEPVRALVQFFQALGMGRFALIDTLLVFLAFTALTLLGVKLICGWGCPVGTLQELLYSIPAFKKIKKKRAPFWLSNTVRIVLFIVFLVFVLGWIPGLRDQSIYRYLNPFKLFEWNFQMTAPIIIGVIFALAVVHYRFYCMWICPFGLWSWIVQNASFFKVRINRNTCIECGKCVRACPTDAAKHIYEGKTLKADCFSCGRCLSSCPNGSLRYAIRKDTTLEKAK